MSKQKKLPPNFLYECAVIGMKASVMSQGIMEVNQDSIIKNSMNWLDSELKKTAKKFGYNYEDLNYIKGKKKK